MANPSQFFIFKLNASHGVCWHFWVCLYHGSDAHLLRVESTYKGCVCHVVEVEHD